jgi:hypothetical protein
LITSADYVGDHLTDGTNSIPAVGTTVGDCAEFECVVPLKGSHVYRLGSSFGSGLGSTSQVGVRGQECAPIDGQSGNRKQQERKHQTKNGEDLTPLRSRLRDHVILSNRRPWDRSLVCGCGMDPPYR